MKNLILIIARIAEELLSIYGNYRRRKDYEARQKIRNEVQKDPSGAFADHFGDGVCGSSNDEPTADKTDTGSDAES
jgi:hypothetical protein